MTTYEPTWDSLEQHDLPAWYDDAKLGIFVHWGTYSVPAWAPVDEETRESGYAEWYPRGMYEEDSEVATHHGEKYGTDVEYGAFLEKWEGKNWNPERWARFFDEVGAGYVVLTAEHHDGIALWDSDVTEWNTVERGPGRDIVTELGDAVRDRNMRFAGSFHALLNFYDPNNPGLFGHPDLDGDGQPGEEYIAEMNARLEELIDRTRPDLLWLDGNWKASTEEYGTKETMAYFYERAREWDKEVVVNDRLGRGTEQEHGDFYTPEYETFDETVEHKWEATRGLAGSFGYNRNESAAHYLSVEELIRSFVDIVSKNGNLLINVGPRADGTIPEIQKERLRGLGTWLDVSGEAIYGTTYWRTSSDDAAGTDLRYTWKDESLYATLLDWPDAESVTVTGGSADLSPDTVGLLTEAGERGIDWKTDDGNVSIILPADPPTNHPGVAYTLKITGVRYPDETD